MNISCYKIRDIKKRAEIFTKGIQRQRFKYFLSNVCSFLVITMIISCHDNEYFLLQYKGYLKKKVRNIHKREFKDKNLSNSCQMLYTFLFISCHYNDYFLS